MTREQIDYLIKINENQRDFAKDYLDKHYYELEENGEEMIWLDRYLKHQRIVNDLRKETPDDE